MHTARRYHTAAVANGKIYVLGGEGGNGLVEEYDPATDTWVFRAPDLVPRTGMGAAVVLSAASGGAWSPRVAASRSGMP